MYDHDGGHGQCQDVHEIGSGLEDDGIGELDTACIAGGLNACRARDIGYWTHQGA